MAGCSAFLGGTALDKDLSSAGVRRRCTERASGRGPAEAAVRRRQLRLGIVDVRGVVVIVASPHLLRKAEECRPAVCSRIPRCRVPSSCRHPLPVGNAEACIRAAAGVSSLTHDDDRAIEACQIWSSAIRYAVRHATFDGVRGYLGRVGGEVAELLVTVARSGGKRRPGGLSEERLGSPRPANRMVGHHPRRPPERRPAPAGRPGARRARRAATPTPPPPSPARCSARGGVRPRCLPGLAA